MLDDNGGDEEDWSDVDERDWSDADEREDDEEDDDVDDEDEDEEDEEDEDEDDEDEDEVEDEAEDEVEDEAEDEDEDEEDEEVLDGDVCFFDREAGGEFFDGDLEYLRGDFTGSVGTSGDVWQTIRSLSCGDSLLLLRGSDICFASPNFKKKKKKKKKKKSPPTYRLDCKVNPSATNGQEENGAK